MTCEEAKKIVKPRLSEKRWTHTKNVKKMAVKLAKQWGADPEKAAVAAILHDSAKELPKSELLQIFADNAIIAENAPARPSPVWHGIAAAILAETQWGVTDPEILSAIRCHTTGKLNMTKLDKIIYLADMTSAERDWPGVEDLRKLEMQDLDRALCDALKRSIDFVEEKLFLERNGYISANALTKKGLDAIKKHHEVKVLLPYPRYVVLWLFPPTPKTGRKHNERTA